MSSCGEPDRPVLIAYTSPSMLTSSAESSESSSSSSSSSVSSSEMLLGSSSEDIALVVEVNKDTLLSEEIP
jgi:hypothetical protein